MKLNFQRRPRAPRTSVGYSELCDISIPLPAVERGWLHGRQQIGSWNVDSFAAKMGSDVWLSFICPNNDDEEGNETNGADDKAMAIVLAGFWPGGGFVELRKFRNADLEDYARYRLRVFADSPESASALLNKLCASHIRPSAKSDDRPRIGLVNISYGSLEVTRVHVSPERLVPKEHAALYYGNASARWIDGWIGRLNERRYGLSVISGEPGTGKTTLLRSLAAWLRDTHLFYFTPASRFNAVDAGELVTFWTDENRYSKLRKVLVLEDAESILLSRNGRNGEQVASLLNLTDGVMGDALGLRVVCTINSELTDIDPALLRPGRLLARREINRLSREEARLLAEHLGKPLPEGETIALAELFNPDQDGVAALSGKRRRQLGFNAAATNRG